MLVAAQTLIDDQVEQFVAVKESASGIHHHQTVSIAVQRDAKVSLVGSDSIDQGSGMRRANLMVDVQAIGRAANVQHICTQLMKHLGSDMVGRAMGRIDHNLQSLERQIVGESAFAKLDIAPGRIIEPPGTPQTG